MVATAIIFDLIAHDSASKKLLAVGAAANTTAGKVARMGARMGKIGSGLSKKITLPALAVGAGAVKMATDFDSAMTRIQTQAGASAKDVALLKAQVLALGGKVQQTPGQLAEALYHLKSVGLSNAQAMKALVQASHLASVGNADLEETTNAVAGAWRTGIKGAGNFHNAVKTLNAIIGAGNMSMSDLNGAMGTGFLATAKTFGLSLHDVGSALALMTDEGTPANAAATRLRMAFSLLGAPSAAAAKQLATVGLSSTALAKALRHGGIVSAIGLLKDHLKGLSKVDAAQVLSRAFGGGRSSAAIMTLINNFTTLQKKEGQITQGMGRFNQAVAAQSLTSQAKFKTLVSTLATVGVELGNKLLPAVVTASQKLQGLVTWFMALPGPVQKVVGGFTLFAVALGPAMVVGSKLISVFMTVGKVFTVVKGLALATRVQLAALWVTEKVGAAATKAVAAAQWLNAAMDANPITIVVAALVALGVGLVVAYKKSKTFRDIVNGALHAVGDAASWLYSHALKPAFDGIVVALKTVGTWGRWLYNSVFAPVFSFIAKGIGTLLATFAGMVSALSHVPGFGWAKGLANDLQAAADKATGLANAIHAIPNSKNVTVTTTLVTRHMHGTTYSTGGHIVSSPRAIGGGSAPSMLPRAAGDLAGRMTAPFTDAMHISQAAPSAGSGVFQSYGAALVGGLVKGITKGFVPLSRVMGRLQSYITAQGQKLSALLSAKSQFAAGFQSFTSSVFSTDLSRTAQDTAGNDVTVPATIADMLAYQRGQRGQARQLKSDVARLHKLGLSNALIKQLQASGASGMAQIHTLAGGTRAQIAALNRLNKQTSGALHGAGEIAGGQIYNDRIAQVRNNEDLAERIAKKLHHLQQETGKHEYVVLKVDGHEIVRAIKKDERTRGTKSTTTAGKKS